MIKMKVNNTRKGDYLLPDLYLEKGENYGRLGRYGILRLHFIAQNKQALYETLLMTNKLTHHLLLVSDSCENYYEELMGNYIKNDERLSEKNKELNPLEWTKLMNNYKNTAEEIVLNEYVNMTWECRINRTDEIGVLANSLNSMSHNLSNTMMELETANQHLKQDMEHIDELNKQRQYFFATASHELKTPITIIKGQVESMIMGIGRYKDTHEVLPETLKEIENMEQLVKEILSISKLEMNTINHMEFISLTDILKRVCEHLAPLATEKNIHVNNNISADIILMGNEPLLEKAVHNIINNAIRHSPNRAEMKIDLSPQSLCVINSGVNIPKEDLDKLFTPFYRVEKSHNRLTGGSGLGLYLVKIILEQHNLSFKIENINDSVCFEITLNSQNLNQN